MPLAPDRKQAIQEAARQIRIDAVSMVHAANSGHPGGPLGMADFMATLFLRHMNLTPETKDRPDRDRFVLGNGHTCAGYYSILSQKGLIPVRALTNAILAGLAASHAQYRDQCYQNS